MPAATATKDQREIVRLLYIQHGPQEASKLSGINYDLVRKWASLGNWKAFHKPSQITPVADNVANELAKLESETRSSLARSAAKLAKRSESADLEQSGHVHNVAKTAAIVHRWDAKTENSQNVVVNVALLGVQPHEVSATVLDVESEGQGSGQ